MTDLWRCARRPVVSGPRAHAARCKGILLAIALLSLVTGTPTRAGVGRPPGGRGGALRQLREEADAAFAAGRLGEAEAAYRKLLFAAPRSGAARKGVRRAVEARVAEILESIRSCEKDEEWRRRDLFRLAADLDPTSRALRKLAEEFGYVERAGRWQPAGEESSGTLPSGDDRAAQRRRQLRLSTSFLTIEDGAFRFHTNVDTRAARSTITQMRNSVISHFRAYRETMRAFAPRVPHEGLDVVLFDTRAQYMQSVGIPGSAGVYIPAAGAGFFFRDGGFDFPTMLHEMTHQLEDKLLTASAQGWFEEGISEYFGAGTLSQGGKRLRLGAVDPHRLQAFATAVRRGTGAYIPMSRFLAMQRAELSGQFYAQAWALVYYLMEVHPRGRAILFDYLAPRSRLARRLGSALGPARDLSAILPDYDLTLEAFEDEFLRYYREGR